MACYWAFFLWMDRLATGSLSRRASIRTVRMLYIQVRVRFVPSTGIFFLVPARHDGVESVGFIQSEPASASVLSHQWRSTVHVHVCRRKNCSISRHQLPGQSIISASLSPLLVILLPYPDDVVVVFLLFLQKPLLGELLGNLSSKMDRASKALKDVPQRFLDVLVDATFKFTDEALNPSEVTSANKTNGVLYAFLADQK